MLILGDVVAVIAILVGTFVTGMALVLTFALVFTSRVEIASERLQQRPGRCLSTGLLLLLVLGGLGTFLLNAVPPVRELGSLFLLLLASVSALGLGGLAHLLGRQIRTWEPSLSPYGGLVRAAAIIVLACLFPVLGWFLVAPLMLMAGLGAGAFALTRRVPRRGASFDLPSLGG